MRTARRVLKAGLWFIVILLVFRAFLARGAAYSFQEVYAFSNPPAPYTGPANPAGGLVQGTDGNFYGTSFAGGNHGLGTVFQVTPAGVVTVLASFNGTNGANPRGTMVSDNAGNFYGVTYGGGQTGAGTVFKITMAGGLTTLHDFFADPGSNPYAGLLLGIDGNLYGSTENFSTIFKLTPAGTYTTLTTCFGLMGQTLNSVLVQGSDSNLYGMAGLKGFSTNGGFAFKLSTNGGLVVPMGQIAGTNGDKPFDGLTPTLSGQFFCGVSGGGGYFGQGALFILTNTGAQFYQRVDFSGANGAYPYAPLLNTDNTNLYGGTVAGGQYGQGVIYSIKVYGAYNILAPLNGTNGSGVYGQLCLGLDGYIYGTARFGGAYGRGTVFKVDTLGNIATLTSFPPTPVPVSQIPTAGVVQGTDGSIYGVTSSGGSNGVATLFQLSPGGGLTNLAVLPNAPVLGSAPLLANDGNFYLTAYTGGDFNVGAVIKITPGGTPSTILSFDNTNGANPFASLIQGTDNLLYGTTVRGGAGYGTAFSVATDGTLIMSADFQGTNGANPGAPLLEGLDGAFYGTTFSGGASNLGTVFQVTSDGAISNLYSFSGPDGANPAGGLAQDVNGLLYGTTVYGGLTNGNTNFPGYGTIFQITTNGALTTLVYFNGTNGANPQGSLIAGPDGNIYGTTFSGGAENAGTVFSVTTNGALTTVYSLSGTDGLSPYAGLFMGNDGALYGATTGGGPAGAGNIFRISEPPVLQINIAGGLIQIAWPGLDASLQLQASGDLSDPGGWSPVPAAPATNSGQMVLLLPMPTNNVFYRLAKP